MTNSPVHNVLYTFLDFLVMSSGLQFIPEGREADYDGVRLDTMVFPSSSVKCVADLKFDKSDILLAGYPKTGRVYQLQNNNNIIIGEAYLCVFLSKSYENLHNNYYITSFFLIVCSLIIYDKNKSLVTKTLHCDKKYLFSYNL